MTDERAEMQTARTAGLRVRNETREQQAIRRVVAEEIAEAIERYQEALEDAFEARGHEADELRADAAENCATIARQIGAEETP